METKPTSWQMKKCSCGDEFCKDYWIVPPGRFVQGSGFNEADAKIIVVARETAAERDRLKAVNAELLEALKGLLAYHYPARSLGLKSAEYRAAKAAIAKATK